MVSSGLASIVKPNVLNSRRDRSITGTKEGTQPGRAATGIRLDAPLEKRTNGRGSSADATQYPTSTSQAAPPME